MKEYKVKRKPLKSSHAFVKSKEILMSSSFFFTAFAIVVISAIIAIAIFVPPCGAS